VIIFILVTVLSALLLQGRLILGTMAVSQFPLPEGY